MEISRIYICKFFTLAGLVSALLMSNFQVSRSLALASSGDVNPVPAILWEYGAGSAALDVAISADGSFVAVACGSGEVLLLDKQGQLLWKYDTGSNQEGAKSVAMSAYASVIAVGCGDGSVQLLDKQGKLLWKYDNQTNGGGEVLGVAVSADASYVAAGDAFGVLHLFDRQGKLQWKYSTTNNLISYNCGVALTADGSFVAASPMIRTFFFDVHGNLAWKYATELYAYDVGLSGDGSEVAIGGNDNRVYFLNNQGKLLWKRSTGEVESISISQDGNYVCAGSIDSNIYLFDRQGVSLYDFSVGDWVTGVSLNTDGSYLAVSGHDGNVYLLHNDLTTLAAASSAYQAQQTAASRERASFYTIIGLVVGVYLGLWLLLFLLSHLSPFSTRLIFLRRYGWLYIPFVSWLFTVFPLILPPIPLGPIQISFAWSRRRLFRFYDKMCKRLNKTEKKIEFPWGWFANVMINVYDILTLGLSQLFATASILEELNKKSGAKAEHAKSSPMSWVVKWLILGNVFFVAIYIISPGYIYAPLLVQMEKRLNSLPA